MNNFAKFAILTFFFSFFLFLSPNANATDGITYFDDSSQIQLNYRICSDQTSSSGKYVCATRTNSGQVSPFLYDSDTGVMQFSLTPDYSYCNVNYPCRIVISGVTIHLKNNGSAANITDNFINGKFWSVHDYFFGLYPQMSGDSTWNNFYNLASSFDGTVNTSSSGTSVCKDIGALEDTCRFGYWQNEVVYDQNNTYSGFDFSVSNDLFYSTSTKQFAFRSFPYDKSQGHLNMTTPAYNAIIYDLPQTSPIVFYLQLWGSETLQEVEDNGDDNGVTDIVQEMNRIDQNMQQAQNTADDIDVDINIPNVLTPFLSLFTDSSCVEIDDLAAWIHSTETVVCSPWSSDIRNVINPVAGFMMNLLIFGFLIRWLHKNENGGDH